MDNNAPVYRSRVTNAFKTDNIIPSLEWPAQSPDLNPIENAWLMIKRKLQTHVCAMKSVEDLYDTIFKICTSFTVEYMRNLYESMPARIRKVQRALGYIIK